MIAPYFATDDFAIPRSLPSTRLDVVEVFSPSRVGPHCIALGLKAGLAIDLKTGWDLSTPEGRSNAMHAILAADPEVIISSPPCTRFSAITALWNNKKLPDDVIKKRDAEALDLFEFPWAWPIISMDGAAASCTNIQAKQPRGN